MLKAKVAAQLNSVIDPRWTQEILNQWTQRQRHHHGIKHLAQLLDAIEEAGDSDGFDELDQKTLRLAAAFHDIVYNPGSKTNEEDSIDKALQYFHEVETPTTVVDSVCSIIEATGDLEAHEHAASFQPVSVHFDSDNKLVEWFCRQDRIILNPTWGDARDYKALLEYEKNIFREYQAATLQDYRKGRIEFLRSIHKHPHFDKKAVDWLIEYVRAFRPRIAVYAGSFDPFHVGHLSVLRKTEELFDKVIVAVGANTNKPSSVESMKRRHTAIQKVLKFHQVDSFEGFLTTYIQTLEKNADVTLVRGLRTDTDFKHEETQLRFLQDLNSNIKVAFVTAEKQYEHVSSSSIREISGVNPESAQRYLVDATRAYNN